MDFSVNGIKYPKTVEVKDGLVLTIRPTTLEDTEDLLAFYRQIPEEDRLVLRRDVTNRQIMMDRLAELQSGQLVSHIGFVEDKIVGESTIFAQPHGWFRHIGDLRVVIDRKFQRKGIGAALTQDMVELAAHRNIDKVQVHLMAGQEAQIKSLKKLGFIEEARLKNHITDHLGDKHDLVILTHYVADLWRRLEDMILDSENLYMRR